MDQMWQCSNCNSLNTAAAKHCYKCRTARMTGELTSRTGAVGAPGTNAVAPRDPSLVGSVLVGLFVAVLVTALWYWVDVSVGRGYFWL